MSDLEFRSSNDRPMIESVDVKTGVSSALARAWQPIMDAGVELVELARGVRRRRKVH